MSVTTALQAEQHVLAEQVRLISRMLPYGLLGSLAGVAVLAIALWETVPQTTMLPQLAL